MNNETYLDFFFIRSAVGGFSKEINQLLSKLFEEVRLNWYLEEKGADGAEIVIAEVKGMSYWRSEEEVLKYLEDHAGGDFWEYLQGYKMFVYPARMRGCNSCGTN